MHHSWKCACIFLFFLLFELREVSVWKEIRCLKWVILAVFLNATQLCSKEGGLKNSARNETRTLKSAISVQCPTSWAIRPTGNYLFQPQFKCMTSLYQHDISRSILIIYRLLYNNPSNSRILIGSRLWSIRGQTHRWRQRSIQVFFNLNQSQFFAKHSNQSVRFIFYKHKIKSVLFSCLSKWRNLK